MILDVARRTVATGGQVWRPTTSEFEIALALALRPGVIRSRLQLMECTGRRSRGGFDRSVDSHIKRLRKRGLAAIRTSYGDGYYWCERVAVKVIKADEDEEWPCSFC